MTKLRDLISKLDEALKSNRVLGLAGLAAFFIAQLLGVSDEDAQQIINVTLLLIGGKFLIRCCKQVKPGTHRR